MVEHLVRGFHNGRRDGRIHGEGDAGHLVKSAELAGQGVHGPLEGVQHLLAGDLDHGQAVAEGMDAQDVVQGQVALVQLHADAAAVDEGDVRFAGLVQVGIGAQVTEVGFRAADDPDGFAVFGLCNGVIDVQIHRGGGNHLVQLLIQGALGSLDGLQAGVFQAQQVHSGDILCPGVQAGRHGTVGADGGIADIRQLCAAAGTENGVAVLVLGDHLLGVMAVAVEPQVDAGGVGDHFVIPPGGALGFVAHVRHDDDVDSAFGADFIHSLLHSRVDGFAVFILHEVVDEVAFGILEIPRGGGAERHRRGDADEADLHTVEFLDDPGLEDQLPVLVEVAAEVGETGLFGQLKEVVHAVVEFMVAGDRDVVSDGVHDVDDGFALGHGADGLTLDGVTVVHEQDVVVLREGFLHGIQAGVRPALVDSAVDVAGEQDHEILLQRGSGRLFREGGAGQQQRQRQQDTKQFFHNQRPPDLCRFVWGFPVLSLYQRGGGFERRYHKCKDSEICKR